MEGAINVVISEVMSSGPLAVTSAKRMVAELDMWQGDDDSLRSWTLDLTSMMRGSREGQEGRSSFLEGRDPDWLDREKDE